MGYEGGMSRTPGFVFATVMTLGCASRAAHACAPAPPDGAAVRIADEEALIAWSAETKTEHFVRRALLPIELGRLRVHRPDPVEARPR